MFLFYFILSFALILSLFSFYHSLLLFFSLIFLLHSTQAVGVQGGCEEPSQLAGAGQPSSCARLIPAALLSRDCSSGFNHRFMGFLAWCTLFCLTGEGLTCSSAASRPTQPLSTCASSSLFCLVGCSCSPFLPVPGRAVVSQPGVTSPTSLQVQPSQDFVAFLPQKLV